jgi:hypothetical protein
LQVHLPGTTEPFDLDPTTTNQLEKRYFLPGNLGFNAFRAVSLKAEAGGSSPIVGLWPPGGGDYVLWLCAWFAGSLVRWSGGSLVRWPALCGIARSEVPRSKRARWKGGKGARWQGSESSLMGRMQNTTAYAPKLWGGDQSITREKAYEEAMVGRIVFSLRMPSG